MNTLRVKIGAVDCVNARPLLWGLQEKLPEGSVVVGEAAAIAEMLDAGKLDVALIPSIDYLRNPEYNLVPDICIASRGYVMSELLICLLPPAEISRVALDPSAPSSSALCRIILHKLFNLTPEYSEWDSASPPDGTETDAFVAAGDTALQLRTQYENFIDLGEAWHQLTGLPFVYSVWAGRDISRQVVRLLHEARRQGGSHLARIACRAAEELHLPEGFCIEYLSVNIGYSLGTDEQAGLQRFQQYAAELGLCPAEEERRAVVFA